MPAKPAVPPRFDPNVTSIDISYLHALLIIRPGWRVHLESKVTRSFAGSLDALAAHHIHATFGLTGEWFQADPQLVRVGSATATAATDGSTSTSIPRLERVVFDHPHLPQHGELAGIFEFDRWHERGLTSLPVTATTTSASLAPPQNNQAGDWGWLRGLRWLGDDPES
jgi:hypothetical protein